MTPTTLSKGAELTLSFPTSTMPPNGRLFRKLDNGQWLPLATFLDRDAKKARSPGMGGLSNLVMLANPNGDWDWTAAGTFWFNNLTVSLPDGGIDNVTRATPTENSAMSVPGDWVAVPHGSYTVTHGRFSVTAPGRGFVATIQAPAGSVPDANWGLVRTFQKVIDHGIIPFIPVLDHDARTATTSINAIGNLSYSWTLGYFSHPLKIDWIKQNGSSLDIYTEDAGAMQSSRLYSLATGPLAAQSITVDGGFRLDDHSFLGERLINGILPPTQGDIVKIDASNGTVTTLLTVVADPGWHVSSLQAARSTRNGASNRIAVSVRLTDNANTQVRDRLLAFEPGGAVDVLTDKTRAVSDVDPPERFLALDVARNGDVLGYTALQVVLFSGTSTRVIVGYDLPSLAIPFATFSPSGNRILYFNRNGDARVTDLVTGAYFQPYPVGLSAHWAYNDNYLVTDGADTFSFVDIRDNSAGFAVTKSPVGAGTIFQVR
ncbi:hypothetical protein [Fimbriimonas ginsengisoli]|nr:hypothetical protein [Fimbriimonas ginsengisoli]